MTENSASIHRQYFTYFGYSSLQASARCFPVTSIIKTTWSWFIFHAAFFQGVWKRKLFFLHTGCYTEICREWLNYKSENESNKNYPKELSIQSIQVEVLISFCYIATPRKMLVLELHECSYICSFSCLTSYRWLAPACKSVSTVIYSITEIVLA